MAIINPSINSNNELLIFLVDFLQAMTTTYTNNNKKLSNLAKIFINNTLIFEIKNLWKNILNNLLKNF